MWCIFNSQNAKIECEDGLYKISFPTLKKRVGVPLLVTDRQRVWFDRLLSGEAKKGTVMLHQKSGRWFVTISITFSANRINGVKTMGIDLGLRNLAVASIGTKTLFFKGSEVAFKRRRFAARRRTLGKLKKLCTIVKSKNKESRWMREHNHRISRQIVNHAADNGVGCIRMEDLTGIRMAKSKKEAGRNLHNWSFHQLQTFITYKAEMIGIKVEFVNPKYTSQTCKCGHRDKKNRKGDRFLCRSCGYTAHADVNASINIANAISGVSA